VIIGGIDPAHSLALHECLPAEVFALSPNLRQVFATCATENAAGPQTLDGRRPAHYIAPGRLRRRNRAQEPRVGKRRCLRPFSRS